MTVYELNREQLDELKESYVREMVENPSYEDLVNAPNVVTDETIFVHYEGYTFTNDDFFCTAEKED